MTLPPAAKHPTIQPAPGTVVSGAYHIHSNRSDGSGSGRLEGVGGPAGRQLQAGLHGYVRVDASRAAVLTPQDHVVAMLEAENNFKKETG